MATFQARVQGLTQLTFATDPAPSLAELTEFLNDGILDVTNRTIANKPWEMEAFTRVSASVTSNGSEKVDRAEIIAVVRESGTADDWRPCRKISPHMQAQVLDIDSLSYASKYHPVYMVAEGGAISVFPVPAVSPDSFKVYYVNNNPRGDDDNSVTYESTGLDFFPKDKINLVLLYAAIQSLKAAASNEAILEDTELVNTYLGLANAFIAEYNNAFQTQQENQPAEQPGRQLARRQQRR